MSGFRHLFPHRHDKVFESLTEKPLDILVGLNFLGLHPEGGQNKNKMENLSRISTAQSHFNRPAEHTWVSKPAAQPGLCVCSLLLIATDTAPT